MPRLTNPDRAQRHRRVLLVPPYAKKTSYCRTAVSGLLLPVLIPRSLFHTESRYLTAVREYDRSPSAWIDGHRPGAVAVPPKIHDEWFLSSQLGSSSARKQAERAVRNVADESDSRLIPKAR